MIWWIVKRFGGRYLSVVFQPNRGLSHLGRIVRNKRAYLNAPQFSVNMNSEVRLQQTQGYHHFGVRIHAVDNSAIIEIIMNPTAEESMAVDHIVLGRQYVLLPHTIDRNARQESRVVKIVQDSFHVQELTICGGNTACITRLPSEVLAA